MDILYSLEGHNPKYGICQHTCQNGIWKTIKNCCYGTNEDNNWYSCDSISILPICDVVSENLIVYTNCYPGH
jgi:hypothetical protein